MDKNNMVDEQTLIKWIVGLISTMTASAFWWVKTQLNEHKDRMVEIEKTAIAAAQDRQDILLEIRGLAVEMKHLRKDHEQMKDDHKELAHQLAAHMQQEAIWVQGLAEDMAMMKSQLNLLPKRAMD